MDMARRQQWAAHTGEEEGSDHLTIPTAFWDRRSGQDRRGHPMYRRRPEGRRADDAAGDEQQDRPVEKTA